VTRRHGQARTGELKRTATGWAIRYRDGRGVRRQRGGFRTKAEAKQVLDDELRKARLGPLYRPEATLRELVDVFMEQYQGAPASHGWMRQHLGKSTAVFGELPIGELDALLVARWRASLPVTMRHGAHRALRQVLAAAVRWQWIDRNVATDVPNPLHARTEFETFGSWEEVDALSRELGPFGPLAIFCVGTGVRPEEALGGDWTDVDLQGGVFTVRRAFAKGRLKPYPRRRARAAAYRYARGCSMRSLSCRTVRACCSQLPAADVSTSTTSAHVNGCRRSRPPGCRIGASMTCATRSRRGASRPG
jgi:integrase